MEYSNTRQTVGTLLSSVPRREEERQIPTLHVIQENLEGLLDLLDGGTQSPTGGRGTSFLFVYPPTWYLVKRRDEKRDARDTRYEIVTLFGPDV